MVSVGNRCRLMITFFQFGIDDDGELAVDATIRHVLARLAVDYCIRADLIGRYRGR